MSHAESYLAETSELDVGSTFVPNYAGLSSGSTDASAMAGDEGKITHSGRFEIVVRMRCIPSLLSEHANSMQCREVKEQTAAEGHLQFKAKSCTE